MPPGPKGLGGIAGLSHAAPLVLGSLILVLLFLFFLVVFVVRILDFGRFKHG